MPAYVDTSSVSNLKDYLGTIAAGSPLAMTRALNKGASTAKTWSGKGIREKVRLPAKYVSDRIKVNKATFSKQQSGISTPYRGVLMSYYLVKTKSTKLTRYNPTFGRMVVTPDEGSPIRTLVTPGGSVDQWDRAFLLKLKNSNQMAIAGRVDGKLKVFYGPSLSQVLNQIKDELMEPYLNDVVAKELDRQTLLLLAKAQ